MCSRDADTTLVKVLLQIKDAYALVFTAGTDNLCFLTHHVGTSQKQNDIYIKNMTKKKKKKKKLKKKIKKKKKKKKAMDEYVTDFMTLLILLII